MTTPALIQVGGSCSTSADCFNGGACLGGTCCGFSNSSMAPSSQFNGTGYSVMDTGTTSCSACNNASQTSSYSTSSSSDQYQCSACNDGYQLFDTYDQGDGNFQCQQTCDPATEFHSVLSSYAVSLTCSQKYPPGHSCSSYNGGDSCLSGRCGAGDYSEGYCCSEAAAAESCGACESVSGACSNQSLIGDVCNTSADCSNLGACLGGTCCAFTNSSMAPGYSYNGTGYSVMDTGTTHCAACNNASRTSSYSSSPYYSAESLQYQCSACNAGSQLFDSFGGYQCQQTCDPSTEYRQYSSNTFCQQKLTSGSSCSTFSMYTSGSKTCLSGLCGGLQYGDHSGSVFCCSEAAAAESCGVCESVSGACSNQSHVGGVCSSSADCHNGMACFSGTCFAFGSSLPLMPPPSYRYNGTAYPYGFPIGIPFNGARYNGTAPPDYNGAALIDSVTIWPLTALSQMVTSGPRSVGARFGVCGGSSCEPRMVICYMPRSTFERTYPAYGRTGRAGVTAADVFTGKGCPVVGRCRLTLSNPR